MLALVGSLVGVGILIVAAVVGTFLFLRKNKKYADVAEQVVQKADSEIKKL